MNCIVTCKHLVGPVHRPYARVTARMAPWSPSVGPRSKQMSRVMIFHSSAEDTAGSSKANESALENPWAAPGYKGAVVSQLPLATQAAVFAAIAIGIAAGTYVWCTAIGPAISPYIPPFPKCSAAAG